MILHAFCFVLSFIFPSLNAQNFCVNYRERKCNDCLYGVDSSNLKACTGWKSFHLLSHFYFLVQLAKKTIIILSVDGWYVCWRQFCLK